MGLETSSAVLRFIDRVRQNPAAAVSPEELNELERAAREEMQGVRIATTAPVADCTELSRKILTVSSDSVSDVFDNLGNPCRIVGFYPALVLLSPPGDPEPVLPPLDAIDVRITLGRAEKEVLMDARNMSSVDAPLVRQTSFCSLGAISSTIANRLMDIWLLDQPYSITFDYQWAMDATTRTALGYGDVLISLNMFLDLLNKEKRWGGRRRG